MGTVPAPAPRLAGDSAEEGLEFSNAGFGAEERQGRSFDLAHPLATDAEGLSDLGEGFGFTAAQAEAAPDHLPFACAERGEDGLDAVSEKAERGRSLGAFESRIGDEGTERGVLALSERGVERSQSGALEERMAGFRPGNAPGAGDLLRGGSEAVLLDESLGDPTEANPPVVDVDGHADQAGLVRQRPLHGLPDPPGGVGGKLETQVRVIPLRRPHESEIAFLDQVEQGQPQTAVL